MLLSQRRGPTTRVISNTGELLEEIEVPGGMLGAPIVADVDADGKLEVLTVAMSDGTVTCWRTVADAAKAEVSWPTSRGAFDGRQNALIGISPSNPTSTQPAGKAPSCIDSGELRLGVNEVVYTPGEGADLVEVTTVGPDGVVKRSITGDKRRPVVLAGSAGSR